MEIFFSRLYPTRTHATFSLDNGFSYTIILFLLLRDKRQPLRLIDRSIKSGKSCETSVNRNKQMDKILLRKSEV